MFIIELNIHVNKKGYNVPLLQPLDFLSSEDEN
jgi:hypothetical protein